MKDNNTNVLIGKRIKDAREKANLTQARLHELTGISITQISAYENGNRNIGLTSLKKIAIATKTTMDQLYSGGQEEQPIADTNNKGKLIINCISALFDNDVIATSLKPTESVKNGIKHYCRITFKDFIDILDDYVCKLADFNANITDYPDPEGFKNQLYAVAAKKINDRIAARKKVDFLL